MLFKLAKAGDDTAIDFAAEELSRVLQLMDAKTETAVMHFQSYNPEITDVLWLFVCPQLAEKVTNAAYDDGYVIEIADGRGSIRGTNSRSVLMGAYRFLRELGCAWVRPGSDGEIIPKCSLKQVKVMLEEFPSYRHRGICIEGAVSYQHVRNMIDWMPKLGYNAFFNQFNIPYTFYDRWYSHRNNALLEATSMSLTEVRGICDETVRELKKRGMLYHAAGHGWTCEPFGIPGESWDEKAYDIPKSSVRYLAKVKGKRALWKGIPLNTNLCYSNPTVRRKIAEAVAKRCKDESAIDYIQVWLADDTNNHCECEACQKMRPSDWYVTLLNEIDAALTEEKLPTNVVFLLYVDLLWEPEQVKLQHPERFTMMFAPITRTYSASIADAPLFDTDKLAPYHRNALKFPESVSENLAYMRKWRESFDGDGFDFDYHYMWDHFFDPGYLNMAKILFQDMRGLHKVGLNGMISCQIQRVFFPTGLGMTAMAAALWNEKADFEEMAKHYFSDAFGKDGAMVSDYMQKLSDAFDPVYLRGEKPAVSEDSAKKFAVIPDILDEFEDTILTHVQDDSLEPGQRISWKYLIYHAALCRLFSVALLHRSRGDSEKAKAALEDVFSYARRNELFLQNVFDVMEFQDTLKNRIQW